MFKAFILMMNGEENENNSINENDNMGHKYSNWILSDPEKRKGYFSIFGIFTKAFYTIKHYTKIDDLWQI